MNNSEHTPVGKRSKVKLMSLGVFLLTFLILLWYIAADRHTPYTDQARVKGLALPVSPMVSGYVTQVNVGLHTPVQQGDTLFLIDAQNYEIALAQAEVNLEKTIQNLNAGESSLKLAIARLSRSRVNLEIATRNWGRTQRVIKENEGALSEADRDRSEGAYLDAVEQVKAAEANLQQQRDILGPSRADNPSLKAALNQLEKAQLDLAYTAVTAPADGLIESFNIELGYFAATGYPLVTLVANKKMWIQANFKENNLSHMNTEDPVSIIFDIAPGKVYRGRVKSIGYGVSTGRENRGDLPAVRTTQGWLRDPQRFPVIIDIEDREMERMLKQGSQAEVVVFTGKNVILNSLAKFRIWILGKLSYLR